MIGGGTLPSKLEGSFCTPTSTLHSVELLLNVYQKDGHIWDGLLEFSMPLISMSVALPKPHSRVALAKYILALGRMNLPSLFFFFQIVLVILIPLYF